MNEIVEWAKRNYVLGSGNDRSGAVDLVESAPWCVKVCEDRLSPYIKVQTVAKSTQSSGTIVGEIIHAHHLARRTGNMLINCQTDDDAADFARTRMMPRLKRIPEMAATLPNPKRADGQGRFDMGQKYILFPDKTFLLIQGPGETNAQSKSASAVWNDEPYLYAPGRVTEFANRVGALWNGKVFNTSVGGDINTDIDQLYVEGTQDEWNFRCMNHRCGLLFVPTWWKTRYDRFVIQYDKAVWDGDQTDWTRMAETVRIVCPHCSEKHPDNLRTRLTLTKYDRAAYVSINPKGNKAKPSYRWNKQSPWGYALVDLVERFLKAQAAKRTGNNSLIKKFVTHDQAESYNRMDHETVGSGLTRPSGNYSLQDVETQEFKTAYPLRIMAWDKQGGANERLEGVCRAFGRNADGSHRSRLVWTGTEENEAKARIKQNELGVYDGLTAEDCAHKPDEVYAACRQYRWLALIGAVRESYEHQPSGIHQVKTSRPYSVGHYERGCFRISWSNSRIKEIVFAKRTQQDMKDENGQLLTEEWGVPNDAPQPYLMQINQRPILKPDNTMEWPEGNDHRHDCECMIEVLWQMYKDGLFTYAPKL